MSYLIVGLIIFLGIHSVAIFAPGWRERVIALADVLLFGGFLAWAVADRISFAKRPPKSTRGAPPGPANDAIAVVLGLGVYAAFVFWLHVVLIGVPVIVPGM